MTDASRTSETSDTPKTDAATWPNPTWGGRNVQLIPADFARDQERRIAELEKALEPFSRPEIFEQCGQIADLITQISHNPVNGADAWRWWLGRHLSVHHFKVARAALQNVSKP